VIEASRKIPTGFGSWPGFWQEKQFPDWPHGGEVDIMEYYKGVIGLRIMDSHQNWTSGVVNLATLPSDWNTQFHVFTEVWDTTTIDLRMDGVLRNHYDVSNADAGTFNPFREPFFLILNYSLGGQSGGDPSNLPFPVKYEVDWVRAFQPQ